MKKKILLALLTALLLFMVILTGCGSSGIPQAQYDQTAAQLADAQAKLTKAQSDLAALQTEKATSAADLKTAQAQVTDLQKQVTDLKVKYEFTGLTTTEKVAQIVKNYHETHTYSKTDLFVCSDMSSEVWNLLKTQGIPALMAIGDITTRLADITLCTHAWVLAEVAPGEYLALETTLGTTVADSKNALYYKGWTFKSPQDIKDYQQIVVKYNEGVSFRNLLANESNIALAALNKSTDPQTQAELNAVYVKLIQLMQQKETNLNSLRATLDGLATVLK